jgi:multiple sugar transport system ATP-binding protein
MGLGDRIIIMEDGIIKQIGTPKEIYEKPDNLFVAKFIGSPAMNILAKQDHYIGFRPENLEIEETFKGSKDDAFKIELNVNRVEFLGNDTLIYCSSDLNIEAGKKYKFFVDNKSIFKYSKDTEKLI